MKAILEKLDTCHPNPDKSYTQQYQNHKILSWSYLMVPSDDKLFKRVMRTRTATEEVEDVAGDFLKSLVADIKRTLRQLNKIYL